MQGRLAGRASQYRDVFVFVVENYISVFYIFKNIVLFGILYPRQHGHLRSGTQMINGWVLGSNWLSRCSDLCSVVVLFMDTVKKNVKLRP